MRTGAGRDPGPTPPTARDPGRWLGGNAVALPPLLPQGGGRTPLCACEVLPHGAILAWF